MKTIKRFQIFLLQLETRLKWIYYNIPLNPSDFWLVEVDLSGKKAIGWNNQRWQSQIDASSNSWFFYVLNICLYFQLYAFFSAVLRQFSYVKNKKMRVTMKTQRPDWLLSNILSKIVDFLHCFLMRESLQDLWPFKKRSQCNFIQCFIHWKIQPTEKKGSFYINRPYFLILWFCFIQCLNAEDKTLITLNGLVNTNVITLFFSRFLTRPKFKKMWTCHFFLKLFSALFATPINLHPHK